MGRKTAGTGRNLTNTVVHFWITIDKVDAKPATFDGFPLSRNV